MTRRPTFAKCALLLSGDQGVPNKARTSTSQPRGLRVLAFFVEDRAVAPMWLYFFFSLIQSLAARSVTYCIAHGYGTEGLRPRLYGLGTRYSTLHALLGVWSGS